MKRRTPLRTDLAKQRAWQRRSKPLQGRSAKHQDVSPGVRAAVIARALGCCEVQAPGCDGRGTMFHHRLPRSHGGRHTVENGLWCCSSCHAHIHGHPALSYQEGWLLRTPHSEPSTDPGVSHAEDNP